MLLLFNLRAADGARRGSAAVAMRRTGEKVSFEIQARNGFSLSGLTAFAISKNNAVRAELTGKTGTARLQDACGLILFDGAGRRAASGASGLTEDEIRLHEVRLSLMLSDRAETVKPAPESKMPTENKREKQAESGLRSAAARSIVEEARSLFATRAEKESTLAENNEPPPTRTAERNPFPRLFPASEWYAEEGKPGLIGRIRRNGRLYRARAVPPAKRRDAGRGTAIRARGADGRNYVIVLTPEKSEKSVKRRDYPESLN